MAKCVGMESIGAQSSGTQQARGLLEEVAGIKAGTRADLRAQGWQWLLVWSGLFFGAGLTALVPGWDEIADRYWFVGVPLGLVLTFLVSWRVERNSPVRRKAWPYWTIGGAITVAGFVVGAYLPDSVIVVLLWVILGFGFAGFLLLERLFAGAWLLAGMAVLSGILGLVVEDTFALYPLLAMSFSAAVAGIAAGMMVQGRR